MTTTTPRLDLVERNLILNGNFDLWQRATSGSVNGYVADRWTGFLSSGTAVASQSTDVPTQAQSGFQSNFSLKLTVGTAVASPAASDVMIAPQHRIEGLDYVNLHGRKCRLQFWFKVTGTNVTGNYAVNLNNNGTTRNYVTTFNVPTSGVWQKVVLDPPLDNTGTWNFDNTLGLRISIVPMCGSNNATSNLNTWQTGSNNQWGVTGQVNWMNTSGNTMLISQVMLIPQDFTQAGSTTVDVPFQRHARNLGEELRACQRYCETSYDVTVPFFTSGGAQNSGSNAGPVYCNLAGSGGLLLPVPFKVTKRAAPVGGSTFRVYAVNSGTADSMRDESNALDRAVTYTGNGSRINTNGANVLSTAVPAGAFVEFNWICDVEL